MSEAVLIQLIGAGQVITVALIGALAVPVFSARKHAREGSAKSGDALAQVANDHRTNLRDDLDGIGHAIGDRLERIEKRLDSHSRSLRKLFAAQLASRDERTTKTTTKEKRTKR